MTYDFVYRRLLDNKFTKWITVNVSGHKLEPDLNKMVLYLENGGIIEVCRWTDCEVSLGQDWVLVTKDLMERESGQNIKLNTKG